MSLSHFCFESDLSRTDSTSQAANCGDDLEWEWPERYRTGVARQSHNSNSGIKKKLAHLKPVNQKLLQWLKPESVEVDIVRVEEPKEAGVGESELDEMWSYVGKKSNPRWLWHAIDRKTGQVLAYVFVRRSDEVFLQLKKLLEPFGIHRYCTDGWGAYERHLPAALHEV